MIEIKVENMSIEQTLNAVRKLLELQAALTTSPEIGEIDKQITSLIVAHEEQLLTVERIGALVKDVQEQITTLREEESKLAIAHNTAKEQIEEIEYDLLEAKAKREKVLEGYSELKQQKEELSELSTTINNVYKYIDTHYGTSN
jgi:chromosome segregation ATPase